LMALWYLLQVGDLLVRCHVWEFAVIVACLFILFLVFTTTCKTHKERQIDQYDLE
jgi:hypothetical protein